MIDGSSPMAGRDSNPARRSGGRVLLIVDMLNGFLDPKGALYCGESSRRIIPSVRRKVRSYLRAGRPVVFVCDSHDPDDPEFANWPAYCVRGTWEAQIVPELPAEKATILKKRTLSCFRGTPLAATLKSLGARQIELVGLCTNICILFAAYELVIRGYRVEVPRKGVASFDARAHRFALEQMKSVLGVKLT